MNHTVIPLFSIPLFKSNLGILNPITKAWLQNLDFPPQRVGHDFTDDDLPLHQRGMHILDKPQLSTLKGQIQRAIDFYVHDVLLIDENLDFVIQTSWVNHVDSLNAVPKHGHTNSMISGVYYIEVLKNSAPIMFEKNYLYTNLFHRTVLPTFRERNQFNMDTLTLQPCSGDIFLFPSHLEHTVPPDYPDNRMSLAFNCFIKGSFGMGTDYLKL